MVKAYLIGLEAESSELGAPQAGVQETPTSFSAQPGEEPLPPGAYGRFPDGTPYYTPGGKPRQPGAMRGMTAWTEDFDTWPDGFLDALHGDDTPAAKTWWMTPDEKAAFLARSEND